MFKTEKGLQTKINTPVGFFTISAEKKPGDIIKLTVEHSFMKKTIEVTKEKISGELKELLTWLNS